MSSVPPLIVTLVRSSAGDLLGALKWRALTRATFVLLIRDPTNAKSLETDGKDTTTVYFKGKERAAADTLLTKPVEHCWRFEIPR